MIHMSVCDQHVANTTLLVDCQRPGDGARIHCDAPVDQERRHPAFGAVAPETAENPKIHGTSIPVPLLFRGTGQNASIRDTRSDKRVNMRAMQYVEEHLFRLGMLLAGGGTRIRRQVAAVPSGDDIGTVLAERQAPRALLTTARELAGAEATTVLDRTARAGWRWLVPSDEEFPSLLGTITDPPLGLFVRGRITSAKTVTIVGSRKATPYGRQVARLLGEELAGAGVVVISGMARGIDESAHRGAIARGGASWAV